MVAVLLAFSRTLGQGFLAFDDPIYIYGEPHVMGGFSMSGIAWAFTRGPAGDWCPLSMLSHMLDCQLYGLNPFGHHLTNLLLHAASAVTLFLVWWRMTGALGPVRSWRRCSPCIPCASSRSPGLPSGVTF